MKDHKKIENSITATCPCCGHTITICLNAPKPNIIKDELCTTVQCNSDKVYKITTAFCGGEWRITIAEQRGYIVLNTLCEIVRDEKTAHERHKFLVHQICHGVMFNE